MQKGIQILKASRQLKFQFPKRTCMVFVPRQSLFNQKWIKFSQEDNTINAEKGKSMKQTGDAGTILDFDDKFGLEKIGDPVVILKHLQECQFSYSMNDLVYFIRKLVQLHKEHKPFKDRREFKELILEIKDRLENNRHETYPWIGSYAKCFKDLEVYDKQLWELFEYKVNEDAWYTNYKESVFALEGFTVMKGTGDQHRIDVLYEKIERIVNITVWDQNMNDYKRIVEALAEVNRFDPVIFAKIEMYILRNMSFDYDIKTIVDILYAFGKGDIGQLEFYDSVQTAIPKGHLFNRNPLMRTVELPFNGETTSKLLSIFSQAKHRIKDFEMNPNFVLYMYKILMSNNTKFTLVNLIDTLRNLGKFEFDNQKEIEDHLVNQILRIEGRVDFKDVQYAIEYLNYRNCGEYEKTPQIIQNQLFQYIMMNIPNSQPEQLIDMHSFLLKRNLLSGPKGQAILNSTLTFLNERMLQMKPKDIEQLLNQIQDHITTLNQDETARIEQYTASRDKIKDYLFVCKFKRNEALEDQSKQEEIIPQIDQKISF